MCCSEKHQEAPVEILVAGFSSWREALPSEITISDKMVPAFGGKVLSIDAYLQKMTELNSSYTIEQGIIDRLLKEGFEIDELEVESSNHEDWGKMVWIKDHPSYILDNLDDWDKDWLEKGLIKIPYWLAVFQTENAGEQKYCLYSTTMGGLHKSFTYHKICLSKP